MNILAKIFVLLLTMTGVYLTTFFPISNIIAFSSGAAISILAHIGGDKFPDQKPVYLAPIVRPSPITLEGQRLMLATIYGSVFLLGVAVVIGHVFHTMGTYIMGLSISGLLLGWRSSSKAVHAHNEWLAAMKGRAL